MIKVGKTWSWLRGKIRGSESSLRNGPPFRDLPEIPEPKARSKARYSVVLINEAGRSRQIEITPFRLRIGLVAAAGVAVAAVVLLTAAGSALLGDSPDAADHDALTKRIAVLEEELRNKELAFAVQEKRLKELEKGRK